MNIATAVSSLNIIRSSTPSKPKINALRATGIPNDMNLLCPAKAFKKYGRKKYVGQAAIMLNAIILIIKTSIFFAISAASMLFSFFIKIKRNKVFTALAKVNASAIPFPFIGKASAIARTIFTPKHIIPAS